MPCLARAPIILTFPQIVSRLRGAGRRSGKAGQWGVRRRMAATAAACALALVYLSRASALGLNVRGRRRCQSVSPVRSGCWPVRRGSQRPRGLDTSPGQATSVRVGIERVCSSLSAMVSPCVRSRRIGWSGCADPCHAPDTSENGCAPPAAFPVPDRPPPQFAGRVADRTSMTAPG